MFADVHSRANLLLTPIVEMEPSSLDPMFIDLARVSAESRRGSKHCMSQERSL